MVQILRKTLVYNRNFLKKYSNDKLTNVGTVLGGFVGFIYLNEYYTKLWLEDGLNNLKSYSNHNIENKPPEKNIKKQSLGPFLIEINKTDNQVVDININKNSKYQNFINKFIISDKLPYSINFFTSTITSSLICRYFTKYVVITMPVLLLSNLIKNIMEDDK